MADKNQNTHVYYIDKLVLNNITNNTNISQSPIGEIRIGGNTGDGSEDVAKAMLEADTTSGRIHQGGSAVPNETARRAGYLISEGKLECDDIKEYLPTAKPAALQEMSESESPRSRQPEMQVGRVFRPPPMLGNFGPDRFELLIKEAEHEICEGGGREDEYVKKVMRHILESKKYSADEIPQKAYNCLKSKQFVRAIILYRISSDLRPADKRTDDSIAEWIGNSIVGITKTGISLACTSKIQQPKVFEYMLKCAEKLLFDIQSLRDANPDVIASTHAHCLINLAGFTTVAKRCDMSIKYCQIGITTLERQYGQRAPTKRNYGHLLNSLAHALEFLEEHSEAKEYYIKAIEAKEQAEDFKNDKEKQDSIDRSRKRVQKLYNKKA